MKKTALILIFLLAGCASGGYSTLIDSIATSHHQRSFYIAPLNPDIDKDDLRFKVKAGLLAMALSKRGYTQVKLAEADMVVFLDYFITRPRKQLSTLDGEIYSSSTFTRAIEVIGSPVVNGRVSRKQLFNTRIVSSGSSGDLDAFYNKALERIGHLIATNNNKTVTL